MIPFAVYLPIAENVALEIRGASINPTRLPMQMDQDGYWKLDLDLDEGVYYYCFLVNNCFWIPDPESSPIIEPSTGKIVSRIKVAGAGFLKLSSDSSHVEIGTIDMYAGNEKAFVSKREFLNTSGEIGLQIEIKEIRGTHLLTFLWINPHVQIAYHSESIITDGFGGGKEPIYVSGWVISEPDRPINARQMACRNLA